ncbi:HNH endonuclease signature motif containing protein [Vibrio parahaemolyticus]|nr:HNH endonuclease signature motif containing protein [Vibrio parahaemolyticus]
MPKLISKTQCNYNGCTNLRLTTERVCKECLKATKGSPSWFEHNQRMSKLLGAKNPYKTKRYLAVREQAIQRDKALCVQCLKNGTIREYKIVDHIKNAAMYPELFHELDNLQCLCQKCSNIKTAEESKVGRGL